MPSLPTTDQRDGCTLHRLVTVCLLAHTHVNACSYCVCVFIHVRQSERNTTRRWELNPYRKSQVVLRDDEKDMTVAK